MTTTHRILAALLLGGALFLLGRWTGGGDPPAEGEAAAHAEAGESQDGAASAEAELWTCPMHPQIKMPDPGDCPICGMDLVAWTSDDGASHPRRLAMSPAAVELARIQTAPAVRREVVHPVRMTGKLDYDETRMRTISAWVSGRLDRLFVDAKGVPVAAGDHLVELYSPELLTAQEELLAARSRLRAQPEEPSAFLRASDARAYRAAREKLLLWGLTEDQVDALEERGTAQDRVVLRSPIAGVVIERNRDEGAYVTTGTPIYRVADLSRLWLRLDAFERDLSWLHYGQEVAIHVEAVPGETFHGRISFIDPIIDPHTRTAGVRVHLDNAAGRLKPGMFARAVVQARRGAGGLVAARELAGKWISPMHPEIVRDEPGFCDVCGMPLVPAEELDLVGAQDPDARLPLVVPASAVLPTGKRGVVYVAVPGAETPTYEGREVDLGPRAGDDWVITAGLREGERVVVQGAFRVDSAMQIRAKPSMMSMPAETAGDGGPGRREFLVALTPVVEAYLAAQEALADDAPEAAAEALAATGAAAGEVRAALLEGEARRTATARLQRITRATASIGLDDSIARQRTAFEEASTALLGLVRSFGPPPGLSLREAHCPMAFDDAGASWLQRGDTIDNPYFGAEMLRCGEIRERFDPDAEESARAEPAAKPEKQAGDAARPAAEAGEAATDPPDDADDGAALVSAYLDLQRALASDAADAARAAVPRVRATLPDEAPAFFADLPEPAPIDTLRARFDLLSTWLIARLEERGNPLGQPLRRAHCPMAFEDLGADWLQTEEVLANPYFGAAMLRCGSVEHTYPAR